MALGFSVVAAVIEKCLAARLLGKWHAASKGTASDRRPVVGLRREPGQEEETQIPNGARTPSTPARRDKRQAGT